MWNSPSNARTRNQSVERKRDNQPSNGRDRSPRRERDGYDNQNLDDFRRQSPTNNRQQRVSVSYSNDDSRLNEQSGGKYSRPTSPYGFDARVEHRSSKNDQSRSMNSSF